MDREQMITTLALNGVSPVRSMATTAAIFDHVTDRYHIVATENGANKFRHTVPRERVPALWDKVSDVKLRFAVEAILMTPFGDSYGS